MKAAHSFLSTFKEVWSTSFWVLSLYFKFVRVPLLIYFIVQIIASLEGVAVAYVLGLTVDGVLELLQGSNTVLADFFPLLVFLIGVRLFFRMFSIIHSLVWRLINDKDSFVLDFLLVDHLHTLGVGALERPEVVNKSQRYQEVIGDIRAHLNMSVGFVGIIVALIGATTALAVHIPLVIPIYIVLKIPEMLADQHFIKRLWSFNLEMTEERRRGRRNFSHLTSSISLKELNISGGFDLLYKKYADYADRVIREKDSIRKKWSLFSAGSAILNLTGFGLGLALIFSRLLSKALSIGDFSFLYQMLNQFSGTFNNSAKRIVWLRESSMKITDARELFILYTPEEDGDIVLRNTSEPMNISVDNITFTYPGAESPSLKGVSLEIKPGEKVAIVGENGAGKTTLIKLLCRIYRPEEGVIKVSDINLNNISIKTWYQKLGVLFQNFNTYSYLSVQENINIGSTRKKKSLKKVRKAAELAEAATFIEKYPKKYRQILSEKFTGGIRPSTGQWQKIAIARFFYRDAPVLILDEPTAAIDAVAEARIFDNIYKFIENKTVIIISHRFSTVRNADRIIVMKEGKIVEMGTHEELLKADGVYSHAFTLQARGYQ